MQEQGGKPLAYVGPSPVLPGVGRPKNEIPDFVLGIQQFELPV